MPKDLTELKQALDGVSSAILKLVSITPAAQPVAEVKAVVELDYALLAKAVGDAVAAALPEQPAPKKRASRKKAEEPELGVKAEPQNATKTVLGGKETTEASVPLSTKDDDMDALLSAFFDEEAEATPEKETPVVKEPEAKPAAKPEPEKQRTTLTVAYVTDLLTVTYGQVKDSQKFVSAMAAKFGTTNTRQLTSEDNLRPMYDFLADYREQEGLE